MRYYSMYWQCLSSDFTSRRKNDGIVYLAPCRLMSRPFFVHVWTFSPSYCITRLQFNPWRISMHYETLIWALTSLHCVQSSGEGSLPLTRLQDWDICQAGGRILWPRPSSRLHQRRVTGRRGGGGETQRDRRAEVGVGLLQRQGGGGERVPPVWGLQVVRW